MSEIKIENSIWDRDLSARPKQSRRSRRAENQPGAARRHKKAQEIREIRQKESASRGRRAQKSYETPRGRRARVASAASFPSSADRTVVSDRRSRVAPQTIGPMEKQRQRQKEQRRKNMKKPFLIMAALAGVLASSLAETLKKLFIGLVSAVKAGFQALAAAGKKFVSWLGAASPGKKIGIGAAVVTFVLAAALLFQLRPSDVSADISEYVPKTKKVSLTASSHKLSEACESHREQVEKTAAKYNMSEYTELLMALMMQESSGRGLDVMQSSEGAFNTRYDRKPNAIKDVSYSIECGVQELQAALIRAGVTGPKDLEHIRQALQAYNFGIAYLDYAEKRGVSVWTQQVVSDYAKLKSNGRTRDEEDTKAMGKWDYGDQMYPQHVLRYYKIS